MCVRFGTRGLNYAPAQCSGSEPPSSAAPSSERSPLSVNVFSALLVAGGLVVVVVVVPRRALAANQASPPHYSSVFARRPLAGDPASIALPRF